MDNFVYLGSLVDTSCRSSPEIRRRIGIARQTFKDLERGVWHSKLSLATKLRIYNISVIAGLLYAGETWTMTAADYARLDAFDRQCLRRILCIRWQDFNERRSTAQNSAALSEHDTEGPSAVPLRPYFTSSAHHGHADGT